MNHAPGTERSRLGPTSGASILVVEPVAATADDLVDILRRAGYRSRAVGTADEAISLLAEFKPDLVLVEWSLPDLKLTTLCRYIRARSDIPVLVASATQEEGAAVASLEAGADGFLTKPFGRWELPARLEAALRRSNRGRWRTGAGAYVVGDLTVDVERHEVWLGGRKVVLPLREFQLLEVLVASPGKVWTRDALMRRLWGETPSSGTKSLAMHVSRIRARIEDVPSSPKRVLTVRGLGYTYAQDGQDPPDGSPPRTPQDVRLEERPR
ncbi:MAG TPA: response regulator transcription factor [Acidimicrobiales bacterium]|jgi:two-component system response regulator RegX3|nr:response regulator transcription factor [Acidimicrobiales bacterium]